MLIPFLYELRLLFDWLCIPTSLTFFEWMRIEVIYAQVYAIKCSRSIGKDTPRGVKKPRFIKLIQGGGLACLIIIILWFPLLFFAYSNALGFPNIPSYFGVNVYFKGYEPIYTMSVESENMERVTVENWQIFKRSFENSSPYAQNFLNQFNADDIVILKLRPDSSNLWQPSPPSRDNLIQNLKNFSSEMKIGLSYEIVQNRFNEKFVLGEAHEWDLTDESRSDVVKILEGDVEKSAVIKNFLPKMLHLKNTGQLLVVSYLTSRKIIFFEF